MKSAIITFLALLLGAFIAWISIMSGNAVDSQTSLGNDLFIRHETAFLKSGAIITNDRTSVQFSSLGDADVVVFPSIYTQPVFNKNEIQIQNGVYLFALSDPFHEYTVKHNNFIIDHVANGVYVVDTTDSQPRFYSLTAMLRISILNDKKVSTKVDVFPSELFSYDPSLGSNYDSVDVFRIGQLAQLTLANHRNPRDIEKLGENAKAMIQIIDEYGLYQKQRANKASELIRGLPAKEDKELVLLEQYGSFFINDSKRKTILRNSLIGLSQQLVQQDTALCSDNCLKSDGDSRKLVTRISETIQSLDGIDHVSGEEGRNILRQYLSLAAMVPIDRNSEYFTKGGSILVSAYQTVFQKNSKAGAYRLLSELYSQYYFPTSSSLSQDELQRRLEKGLKDYVVYLVTTKSMKDSEFIGFVYFLKEFLASDKIVSQATIELFNQIISISKAYVQTLEKEDLRFQGLSVMYYTFSSIAEKLHDNLFQSYFVTKDGKPYLKPEYVSGNTANLPDGFLKSLDSTLRVFDSFNQDFGGFFDSKLGGPDSSVIDSKSLSATAFDKFRGIQAILVDYQTYVLKASLKDGGPTGLGPKIQAGITEETVKQYFSQFEGADMSTFVVVNDPTTDGYYRIVLMVDGRKFRFAYLPDSSTIREIVFIDVDSSFNQTFKSQSINLEQKKKTWLESMKNLSDRTLASRYDFKFFFRNTFYPEDTSQKGTVNEQVVREEMPPEMKRFVSSELIKNDFTYVSDIMPIGLQHVYAKIVDGEYSIQITDPILTIPNYQLKLRSEYLYSSSNHAFKNIELTAYMPGNLSLPLFKGQNIIILPHVIRVDEFSEKTKSLPKLLDGLRRYTNDATQKIVIDLDSNTINIDGNEHVIQ